MILAAACLSAVVACATPRAVCSTNTSDGGFARALELVAEGELVQALDAAESETDPQQRGQARVYVLLKAGDLAGAYHAATEGLASAPDDLWLRERQASIAISLRQPDHAREAVDSFAAKVDAAGLEGVDLEGWKNTVASYEVEVRRLEELRADQASALTRSRAAVGAALGILLALLFLLARRPVQSNA